MGLGNSCSEDRGLHADHLFKRVVTKKEVNKIRMDKGFGALMY